MPWEDIKIPKEIFLMMYRYQECLKYRGKGTRLFANEEVGYRPLSEREFEECMKGETNVHWVRLRD
jgi:hypothetical protein